MGTILNGASDTLVVVGEAGGRTMIPTGTPLTRLNYFDGKFLRADDLRAEQDYLRSLVHLSNRAGGRGVVHGLDLTLDGDDRLHLSPGMAVDGEGRVLLLPTASEVAVHRLLELSRERAPGLQVRLGEGGYPTFQACEEAPVTDPEAALPTEGLYLILLSHTEALCGHEDVYGRLCEDRCAQPGDRPWRLEGVLLRAIPLVLGTELVTSSAVSMGRRHERSRVASAYFADARRHPGSLVSGAGLRAEALCRGAEAPDAGDVPLGILSRRGETTIFLDAWTARRERMEAPPQRYWRHRFAMRPWNLFWAELLQFQCQLRGVLSGAPSGGGPDDPCDTEREALEQASQVLSQLEAQVRPMQGGGATAGGATATAEGSIDPATGELHSVAAGHDPSNFGPSELRHMADMPEVLRQMGSRILSVNENLTRVLQAMTVRERILIRGGIVELPPAGYLPVDPTAQTPLDRQVRTLLGEGLDLRFCSVRPDYVPHALEEARHMDRISLLRGLDDPDRRPAVDVLVPDGRILEASTDVEGLYDLTVEVTPPPELLDSEQAVEVSVPVRGALRAEASGRSGGEIRAGFAPVEPLPQPVTDAMYEVVQGVWQAVAERMREQGEEVRVGVSRRNLSHEMQLPELDLGGHLVARVERDPFSLAPGSSVALHVEVALSAASSAGRAHAAIVLQLDGRVRLASVSGAGGSTRRLEGRITRARSVATPYANGHVGVIESDSVDLEVAMDLRTGPDGPTRAELRVDLSDNLRAEMGITWSGDTARFQVQLRGEDDGEMRIFALGSGSAIPDGDVGRGDHPAHQAAGAALDDIGAALGDSGYRAETEARLFDAVEAAAAEQAVRGPHDWVFFHRRRHRDCGVSQAPRPELPERSYRVFLVELAEQAELEGVQAILRGEDEGDLSRFETSAVGSVVFGGGSSDLRSSASSLRTAWQAQGPGGLAYGIVAPSTQQGESDPTLVRDRLGRVEQVVDEGDRYEPLLETREAVPAGLPLGEDDGVMVLVTVPEEVRTVTHHVFAVAGEARNRLLEDVQANGIDPSDSDSLWMQLTTPLGTVTFPEDGFSLPGDFDEGTGRMWVEAFGERVPERGDLVAQTLVTEALVLGQQARSIADGLGGALNRVGTVAVPESEPFPFDVVTLLVPSTQVDEEPARSVRMYAYLPTEGSREIVEDSPGLVVEMRGTGLVSPGITDEMVEVLSDDAPFRTVQMVAWDGDMASAQERAGVVAAVLQENGLMDQGAFWEGISPDEETMRLRSAAGVDDIVLLDMGERG